MHKTREIAVPHQTGSSLGDLRTPGLLGKYPIIGLVLVLLGTGLFILFAANVQTNGPLTHLDTQIADRLHSLALRSSPFVRSAMHFTFYLGVHGVEIIGVLLGLYFIHKRFWPELSMIAITWIGEGAIWRGLSLAFDRPRPEYDTMIYKQMSTPGFPSGHCITAVMCFGLLAYWFVPKMPSLFWKIVVIMVALLLILYIGFGRMFVGAHFLTDVLAGYAIGIAWSGLVYTSVEMISQRKKKAARRAS